VLGKVLLLINDLLQIAPLSRNSIVLSIYSLLFQPILIFNFFMDFNSTWCLLYI